MLLVKSDYNPEEENETDRFSAFWFEVADVKSASRKNVESRSGTKTRSRKSLWIIIQNHSNAECQTNEGN